VNNLSIVTYSRGGPKVWADGLVSHLSPTYKASVYASRADYIRCIFSKHHILHSNVALPSANADRYILTIHGDYRREKFIGQALFPIAIRRADLITVPSTYLKCTLDLADAQVIPNGINTPSWQKLNYELVGRRFSIGIITNFNFKEKANGVLRLAQALATALPNAQLLVAGDGIHFLKLQAEISATFPRTTYYGHCDTGEFLKQLDLFAYFSLLDNQPIAILEAMASGIPVISNAIGGVPEIMSGHLSQFVFHSFSDYCDCLVELSKCTDLRETLGGKCHARSLDFLWANITHAFSELYSK
jgi:L-malate glycosyltransferase